MSKNKISFIIHCPSNSLSNGGAETLHQFAFHLKKNKFNVNVIYFPDENVNLPDNLLKYNIPITSFKDEYYNINIIPEVETSRTKIVSKGKSVIYWLSVDGIMHKVDRASMYSGLEAREPLLDYKLVEYALSLPEHLKMKGGELKYLLKKLAQSKIPKELIERPKQRFNRPIVEFTLIIFKEHKNTLLNKSIISEQNIFDYNEIESLKNEIENHKYNRIRTVWLLIIFQIWYYNFFED